MHTQSFECGVTVRGSKSEESLYFVKKEKTKTRALFKVYPKLRKPVVSGESKDGQKGRSGRIEGFSLT